MKKILLAVMTSAITVNAVPAKTLVVVPIAVGKTIGEGAVVGAEMYIASKGERVKVGAVVTQADMEKTCIAGVISMAGPELGLDWGNTPNGKSNGAKHACTATRLSVADSLVWLKAQYAMTVQLRSKYNASRKWRIEGSRVKVGFQVAGRWAMCTFTKAGNKISHSYLTAQGRLIRATLVTARQVKAQRSAMGWGN